MMNMSSCMRCGKCCTRFAVCVTSFDVKRIVQTTGKKPEEFLSIIPDHKDRERKEPAILIDGNYCLLVLQRKMHDVCMFYTEQGCTVYENRPMLCRSYPFLISKRACPEKWQPEIKEKQQYEQDCEQYQKEVERFSEIAEKWNASGGGSFLSFLEYIKSK